MYQDRGQGDDGPPRVPPLSVFPGRVQVLLWSESRFPSLPVGSLLRLVAGRPLPPPPLFVFVVASFLTHLLSLRN